MADSVLPADRGDFVDSDDEVDIEIQSEDPQKFLDGSHYPVFIGELLNHRYQVVHKLGRGGCSTVWLANDRSSGIDVALKILSSTAPGAASNEYDIHKSVIQRVQDRSRLVLCQEHFLLSKVDGDIEHDFDVLVLTTQGPNLLSLQHGLKRPLPSYMSAAKQLLQAIATLHKGNLVHRDIVLSNVVCGLNIDLGKLSIAEQYHILGRPRKSRALGEEYQVIAELVAPAVFPPEILNSDAYYLCNFGILVNAGTSVPNKLQSPAGYSAPELPHGFEPSFASDIWSYMVCFIYLYTTYPMFPGIEFAGKLDSIVERASKLPSEWKGRYCGDGEEDYWYRRNDCSTDFFSSFLYKHRPYISQVEKGLMISTLSRVFRVQPEDRVTAPELLENEDFKTLMDIHAV